jgi:hypothetical protein
MRAVVLAIVMLVSCGPDERIDGDVRDTPGGGFGSSCITTADCGCYALGDDPLCEGESMQLQCMPSGLASTCTAACDRDGDCQAIFVGDPECISGVCNP